MRTAERDKYPLGLIVRQSQNGAAEQRSGSGCEPTPRIDGLLLGTGSVAVHLSLYGGGFLREHFTDAFDLRAYGFEFFFDIFVSAVDVVDAVDDGLSVGDQRSKNERG